LPQYGAVQWDIDVMALDLGVASAQQRFLGLAFQLKSILL
jgi:hypothetical protein